MESESRPFSLVALRPQISCNETQIAVVALCIWGSMALGGAQLRRCRRVVDFSTDPSSTIAFYMANKELGPKEAAHRVRPVVLLGRQQQVDKVSPEP